MADNRLVLDTNVIVSALLSEVGNPCEVWNKVIYGEYAICFSRDILAEYIDVLARPKLGINGSLTDDLLAFINHYGIEITPKRSGIVFVDEDDRVFYDTAKTGNASLITGNKKHYPEDVIVLTPAEFIIRHSIE